MDINRLLAQKESGTLEFKETLRMKDEICAAVSSFSNASGGAILIGVTDAGALKGLDIGKKTTTDLAEYIKKNTDPNIFPEIKVHDVESMKIISVIVNESHDKPVFFRGRAYKRVGDTSPKISSSEIRKLAKESPPKMYWDEQICERAAMDDIDEEAVRFFRMKYKEITGKEIISSKKELLKTLKCIIETGCKTKITNACVLLFGKDPAKFFARYYITIARYPGNDIGDAYLDITDIEGNLFDMIDHAEKYINEHTESLYRLKKGQMARERIPQYPEFAIRELIANAVAHRDYSISGSRIIIKMFRGRIEFDSPGGFPGDVNKENILEKQFSRNPVIVKVLNKIRYVEELGEGWNRIIDEIKSHPLKPVLPEIKDNGNVVVRLFSPALEAEKKIEPLMSQLNERQKRALEYLKEHGKINRELYCDINDVKKSVAYEELKFMVTKMIIEQIGKGKATFYALSGRLPDDCRTIAGKSQ